ncbi:MAG: hypothetical protein V1656_01245 [Candidatus Jorgensenbacteria bacterium]
MRNKYFLSALILSISIGAAAFIVADGVSAQAPMVNPGAANIQYPVAELGNCGSEAACKTYCDDTARLSACLAFAEKNGLMSDGELKTAKQFAKAGGKGPGGCTGKEDCNRYCDDVAHIDACISFAEQNGMISGKELDEAKKVQAAIAKGVKPPACGGKQACDQYCSEASHMEECIAFGQAAGFMSEQEIKDSQKMLAAVKKGAKPPACKGKAECDKYCNEEGHMEECIAFSEAAGFMKPEEAAMARKTGGKGPGGCMGKEVCDAFCNNPDNQQACFDFGKENGMIPPEELQKMEQGKQQFSQSINQAPAEVINCISGVVGADRLEKFKSGAVMPSRDIGDKIGGCFQQMMGPGGPGEGGNIPPGGQNGQSQPWADMCSNNTALACVDGAGEFVASAKVGADGKPVCPANSTAKCGNYQQNNQQGQGQDQRGQFQPGPGNMNPGGQMMPQQAGPGGCKTPEECQSYCTSNPDACKNFAPSGAQGSGGSQQGMGMPPVQCEGNDCKAPPAGFSGEGMQQKFKEQFKQMMPGGAPGIPMRGQGSTACAPGTQCGPGPGTPGQPMGPGGAPSGQGMGMSGTQTQQFAPPSGEGMMPPSGSGPMQQQIQQQVQQQVQQMQQQFQQGPASPPPGGGTPASPPPPTGGSLLNSIKSFFGR